MSQSGEALATLITDPELTNVTGKYFSGFNAIASSIESYDKNKAKQLWNSSIELAQLDRAEIVV